MAHNHYPGFSMAESSLKIHLEQDHGLKPEDMEDEDVVAWHDAQHPEITDEVVKPTIEDLIAQITSMQGALDDLVLDSLLNG